MGTNPITSINPEFQHFCKNRDIVFFLGAGFFADLGLPIMRDFRSASELEYNLLSKELDFLIMLYRGGIVGRMCFLVRPIKRSILT